MSNIYLHTLFVLLVISFSACSSDIVESYSICNKNAISSSKLISVGDAARIIASSDKVISIEVSKPSEYQSGHISQAINVWRPDFRSKVFTTYKGMICSNSELEYFLQNLGATENSLLLLYDNKGGCDAMRLSWVLDCYNVRNYKVINGGKAAWAQAKYPIDTTAIIPVPNPDYRLDSSLDSSLYAFTSDVLAAIKDTNTILVDTRELYEYRAQPFMVNGDVLSHKKGAFSRGSIPGAVHLNWSVLSDLADDHRIKCHKDLIYDLEAKGISKDKKVIVYCQSGSRSSHTAFVFREILGFANVKNYDGSWIEWSYLYMNGAQVPIEQLTSDSEYEKLYYKLTMDIKTKNG